MEVKLIPVNELKPYEKNAKIHDAKHVTQIAESIKRYGFRQPILIDHDNVIIAGHGRWQGAKKAGMKTVPCVCADDMTEEQVKEYRLADNKLNESPWDFDLLGEELDGLDFGDLDLDWGFTAEPEAKEPTTANREIDTEEYEDGQFECECPRCGFRFNRS